MTGRAFETTEWSVVLAAAGAAEDSAAAHAALEALCQTYWYPLYAFARRQTGDAEHARDLTQAFFARLLETDLLAQVDRDRGRFRSFLLACMRHFIANAYDRQKARKRGGGRPLLPLDFADAESRYAREPAHDITPERLYIRRWAMTLLARVLADLRKTYTDDGKAALFEALKGTIGGESTGASYAEIAAALEMTEGAVKVAVHRLRKRYRERLRAEIGRTVSGPLEVDAELYALLDALSLR